MINKSTNTSKQLSEYTPEELKTELKAAVDSGDFKRAQEVSAELLSFENIENAKIKLTEDQEKMLEKIRSGKAKKQEMQDFIDNDIKNRKSATENKITNIDIYKDSKIQELEAQLKEKDNTIAGKDKEIAEKDSIKETLNKLPGLHDLNFKNLKFLKVGKKLGKMEEEGSNPKEILLYCMAVTKRQLLGTRTAMKRGLIKGFLKRKENSIITNDDVQKLKNDLLPDPNNKSKFQEAFKKVILTTVEKQQKKYSDEITGKITGKDKIAA